jgi:predicted site-specific integrase-resolvase
MRKIGYARVSAQHQSLDRQLGALRSEGCIEIFREKASGKSTRGRPQLEKAIDELGTGDVLVLAEWDRCTRSMVDAGLELTSHRYLVVVTETNAPSATIPPSATSGGVHYQSINIAISPRTPSARARRA